MLHQRQERKESAMGGFRDYFEFIPFTPLFNATGQPAMSVPLHWNDKGLPIGMQFVGRYADEATLFRLAAQLERAQPWFDRIAPLCSEDL
jgi:amidase